MTRTKKLILVAIFTLIVVLLIFFILRLPKRGSKDAARTPQTTGQLQTTPAAPTPLPPPPRELTPQEKAIEDDKAAGRKTSIIFAERFGSFSNQAAFANITDLIPIMTANMRKWADNFRTTAGESVPAGVLYYGITTRGLVATVLEYLAAQGRMRVVVGTQREETTDGATKVYTQELTAHLVREAGVWKIDRIQWGEPR